MILYTHRQSTNPADRILNTLADEIARRSDNDELVPIDRDPVPDEYADLVREYYERLGRGR